MRFSIQREALLKPLTQVVGLVERRHTLPILANLLVNVDAQGVEFIATDLEAEMRARAEAENIEPGEVTIPARKLFDICRALPDGARIEVKLSGDRVSLNAGRSRFTLVTLSAADFPLIDQVEFGERMTVAQETLKSLLDRTAFAMANQDVRYYLNGTLLDVHDQVLRCVATDGHRLATCETAIKGAGIARRQVILPRKAVLELQRLLEAGDGEVELAFGRNHVRVTRRDFTFTTKLIDGRFPDYEAVIPIGADKDLTVDRETLKAALQRAAILSSDKYRGVKLEVEPNQLKIIAHNPEQEEAIEELEVSSSVSGLAVGFNVNYLLDALSALRGEITRLSLRDSNSSCLIRDAEREDARHVVMPLRL